jgi:uncharacterized ubiquitin-like protein YukD
VSSHVDVTLVAAGLRADLRIPTRVSVHRLVGELAVIFPGIDAGLPTYQLQVLAKGLLLTGEDVLATEPVTDGDVIELIGGTTDGG